MSERLNPDQVETNSYGKHLGYASGYRGGSFDEKTGSTKSFFMQLYHLNLSFLTRMHFDRLNNSYMYVVRLLHTFRDECYLLSR
jgi:hypothetical protein